MTMLAVTSGTEQQMARSGSLICMACLRPVTAWYTFTFNNTKLLICASCNQDNNRELDARKGEFRKALLKINDDLLRAIELDPTSPNPKNNLNELKKIASQLSIVLPGKASAPARTSKPAPTPVRGPAATPVSRSTPKPASKPVVAPTGQASFWATFWTLGLIAFLTYYLLKPMLVSASFSGPVQITLTGLYFSLPAILAYVLTRRPEAAAVVNIAMYYAFFPGWGDVKNLFYILATSALFYYLFRRMAGKKVTFGNLFGISLLVFGLEILISVLFWQWRPDFQTLFYNVSGCLMAVIITVFTGKIFKKL
jgi:hypothetical protein